MDPILKTGAMWLRCSIGTNIAEVRQTKENNDRDVNRSKSSFIGRWISGEPMAREINPQYPKKLYKIIQKEVPVIQSKDVDFFSVFLLPKESKAQSLPHVYPSTSVCLSLGLCCPGDSGFSEDNRSGCLLDIPNPLWKIARNFREKHRTDFVRSWMLGDYGGTLDDNSETAAAKCFRKQERWRIKEGRTHGCNVLHDCRADISVKRNRLLLSLPRASPTGTNKTKVLSL